MKKICSIVFVSLALLAIISGCVTTTEQQKPQYINITVQQGKEMINRSEVFILDVRTQEEYNEGHIRGSTLIPVQVIDKRLNELPRDRKILVYCRTGHRSRQASEILVNNGFTQVYNMDGGITEWTKAGYEVVK